MSTLPPLSFPLATFEHQDSLELALSGAGDDPLRIQLQSFVCTRFAEIYGASVQHFMPELLGLRQADALQAVVGLRPAMQGALFLEQYLDEPACQMIAARSGVPVRREHVIEVGNLAALAPGGARMLIVALTHYLAAQGYRWVVFTGTAMLLNSFQRLALSPVYLGLADPARLGDQQGEWGSYYVTRPRVMAGYIPEGLAQLEQRNVLERMGYRPNYATRREMNDVSA